MKINQMPLILLFCLCACSMAEDSTEKIDLAFVGYIAGDVNKAYVEGEKTRLHILKKTEGGVLLDEFKEKYSLRAALSKMIEPLRHHKDTKLIVLAYGFDEDPSDEISDILLEDYLGKTIVYYNK